MNSRGLSDTWIGGNDIDEEGAWKWTDASHFDFTFWNSGEPNNSEGNEDCMHAWGIEREVGETWNDKTCSDSMSFLCSKKRSSGQQQWASLLEIVDPFALRKNNLLTTLEHLPFEWKVEFQF